MSKVKKRNRSVDSGSVTSSVSASDKDVRSLNKELFLQAFEKPTQIYRYLRSRHLYSPIFLNRNLSYMKHRMSRTHRNRKLFKVGQMLQKLEKSISENVDSSLRSQNLKIIFKGIEGNHLNGEFVGLVDVTVALLKICHKKRKDIISPVNSIEVAKCKVPITSVKQMNTNTNIITILKENFNQTNKNLVKSFTLRFTATLYINNKLNGELNSDDLSSDDVQLNNTYKKRKLYEDAITYKADLIVFDKNNKCLIDDGEYQLALHQFPCQSNTPSQTLPLTKSTTSVNSNSNNSELNNFNKLSIWQTINCANSSKLHGFYESGPILVFNLIWSNNQINGFNLSQKIFHSTPFRNNSSNNNNNNTENSFNNENNPLVSNHTNNGHSQNNLVIQSKLETHQLLNDHKSFCLPLATASSSLSSSPTTTASLHSSSRILVIYQFMFNNNTMQKTKASSDFRCPWCSLNCVYIYSLMKHLKLCHSRFNFVHSTDPKGHRIDVKINESFDGSYSGNPHDLSHSTTGFAFSRNGPVRRTPVTFVLVSKAKKMLQSLVEFLDADDNENSIRPFISGHNRLYYHTNTCLPISPEEMNEDSEAENDPEWMRIKSQLMIDEFTDVNEGEKEVMKLWNLHIMHFGYVGDCQIPVACNKFVDNHWQDIVKRNLYKNFLLHLSNLHDFGLLTSTTMRSIIRRFNQHRLTSKEEFNEVKNNEFEKKIFIINTDKLVIKQEKTNDFENT